MKQTVFKMMVLFVGLCLVFSNTFYDMSQQGFADITDTIGSNFSDLYQLVEDAFEPFNQPTAVKFQRTKVMVEEYLKEYNTRFETDVADFKQSITEAGFSLFKDFTPLHLPLPGNSSKPNKE